MESRRGSAYAQGIAAITVTSVLWGTTGTAATFMRGVSPLAVGALSLGVGGLLQTVVAVPSIRRELPPLIKQWRTVLVGGLAVFVYPLAFYSSMHLAGVAVGSVISLALAPIFAGLYEKFVDGIRLGPWWLLSVCLGGAGAIMLAMGQGHSGTPAPAMVPGVLLGLLAAATYALYSWSAGRLMRTGGIHRAASMGAVFGVGGLLLMPVLVVTGQPLLSSSVNLLVAAYLTLIPMFLGYLLFGFGLAHVPASVATTITLLEPAVAALLAVAVVGERLTLEGWAGLAAVFAVLGVLSLAPGPPNVAAPVGDELE